MEQPKRGPGRPSTGKGRKPRLDFTVSREVADFLRDYGRDHNVSAFIEGLIHGSQPYQDWEDRRSS